MRAFRSIRVAFLAALVAGAAGLISVPTASAGTSGTFILLYRGTSVPSDAAAAIEAAGGTLVQSYPQIGVAIATSDDASFGATLESTQSALKGAVATSGFGTQLSDVNDLGQSDQTVTVDAPAPGEDSLGALQWDMAQIHAFEAHEISGGDPDVVVGDIDTGLDFTHPDLAPNVDFGNSVSCVSGAPDTDPAAWMDDNGHGTHTAGTIAAARNDIGIVGVAPNVKIAGIKAGNADGFFFPEAVICAFMWAGTHDIAVTNNSYFADPWYFNCKNDPEQRAIWEAERRAIRFAISNGTTVVAAEGNFADDLAHPTMDLQSPDDTTPVPRSVTNACAVVPVEVPGVIGVTADGNLGLKSFYSSYGIGTVQVIAPGGDSILQVTPDAVNGRVLSTWPSSLLTVTCAASRRLVDASGATYCYQQGTSMASPHAAGVAALIVSQGITSPGDVAARLAGTADPMACPPDLSIYDFFPSQNNGAPQTCQGGPAYNGFNGHGQVNALSAVS